MAATATGAQRLVLITGASRGFGKSLALETAKAWGPALDLHLIARSEAGLAETRQAAEAAVAAAKGSGDGGLRVWTWPLDLGDLDALPARLDAVFATMAPPTSSPSSCYERAYLFNNAGLVGPIAYAQDLRRDWPAVRRAVDVNVTSFVYLTALFLEAFGPQRGGRDLPAAAAPAPGAAEEERARGSVVVNVSSLAAVQPFESWGMYCAGKAARDMLTTTIAKEQQATAGANASGHKTLNYAPGPLDTDMQAELRGCERLHPATREWSLEAFKEGKLVPPAASAAKCLRILVEDTFASGAHVDYYDDDAV